MNPLHQRLHISYTRLCWLGNLVPIKCVVVTLSHANEMAIVDIGLHNGKAPLLMEREPDTDDQDEFEVNFLSNNIRTVKSPSTCTHIVSFIGHV